MKKLFSVILILSMLILCACSGKEDNITTTAEAEPTTSQQETTTVPATKKDVEYFNSWGSELIPEKFPAPPQNAHSLEISTGKAVKTGLGYHGDWVRVIFTCSENDFFNFAKQIKNNGYIGNFKNFINASYYKNGFKGYWQDGTNIITINNAETNESGEIEFTLDIVECIDNYPDALLEFFPKFNGYSLTEGTYCGHNEENDSKTIIFPGSFTSPYWHWDFRFSNGFIGVEQSEFEDYYNLLVEEEFSGAIANTTVDGTSVITVDLIKESGEYSYGVFMVYNQTLKTLDIAYTNDSSIYLA